MNIECVLGDLADQPDLDAVVNAANAELIPGGGVDGALHRAAGPLLAEASAPLGPLRPGQAVLTPAFELPNTYVIHVLGPRYGIDEPAAILLSEAYRNALRLAGAHRIERIGFPAVAAGAFGYPLGEAARIALETVRAYASDHQPPALVRFVLFNASALAAFRRRL